VLREERRAVHLVGEQHVVAQCVVERQAALIGRLLGIGAPDRM